ncbi:MAG: DICT sensory domain-containing protein [Solirubrobacteraceae bacterium]
MTFSRTQHRVALDSETSVNGHAELSIGDIAARTGVGEATLRMWEARYGFPVPERLPSGHRRYSEGDLQGIRVVLQARAEGLSLPVAIDRARRLSVAPRPSVYGAVRDRFAHLHPQLMPKLAVLWLSRAIEDECAARAPHPLLIGCFQHESRYRVAEHRWRELSRNADRAIVLADFPRLRRQAQAPIEVPVQATDPVLREWVVVCDAPQLSACLIGSQRPSDAGEPQRFETVWTIEPDVVREAALACCDLIARTTVALADEVRARLAELPAPDPDAQLRVAVELATRVTLYASAHHRGAA